jgi:hypothetical protein
MTKKPYSFNLEEKIVESIPGNKSSFVTIALCKTMLEYIDATEQSKQNNMKNAFKELLEGRGIHACYKKGE